VVGLKFPQLFEVNLKGKAIMISNFTLRCLRSHLFLILSCWVVFNAHAVTTLSERNNSAPIAPSREPISKEMVQSVFAEICNQGIAFPQEVMKQAILETGWFRSHFLMSRNNLFGFRKTQYFHFKNWQESVIYYKKWQDSRLKTRHTDYLKFLKTFNYGSPDYTQHLATIKWEQKCPQATMAPPALVDMPLIPASPDSELVTLE
jgi:hypothetical protein